MCDKLVQEKVKPLQKKSTMMLICPLHFLLSLSLWAVY